MIQSYPWYIADWRESETRIRLSLAERALYREMLDYCYLEGSLPSDPVQLSRICGCSVADVRRHFEVVSTLFCLEGNRLTHSKVTEVRAKLDAYHKQKAHAGAASGQTRRKQALERKSNVRSTAAEPSPTPAPEPTPAPAQRAPVPIRTMPSQDYGERYEKVYANHPKPGFHFEGQSFYHKIISESVNPEIVADAIDRSHDEWLAYWSANPGAFVPGIGKWFEDSYYLKHPREPTKAVPNLSKAERMLVEAEEILKRDEAYNRERI